MAQLAIDRVHLQLQCRAHASRAAAIELRLRDVVRHRLPAALQRLEVAADAGAAPLVFIDEVRIDAVLATAWDDERLAQTFARSLMQHLQRELAHPSSEGLRCFDSRAQWLAEFMLALVQGQAWRRWWFRALDGLAALPVSAALRTLIEGEGDEAVLALLALTPGAEAVVWQQLGEGDGQRLLAHWSRRADGARVPLPALLEAARALPGGGVPALLRAAVSLQRQHPGSLNRRTLTLLAALADESNGRGTPSSAAAGAAVTAWQEELDATEREQVAAWREPGGPLGAAAPTSEPVPAAAAVTLHTPHGGALVLMTVLQWLRWPARWLEALGSEDDAAALVRAMSLDLIARTLQPRQPRLVLCDPALRALWQLGDGPALLRAHAGAARRARRAAPGAGAGRQLLRALAERVPGCAEGGAAYLRRNLLTMPATLTLDHDARLAQVRLGRAPLHVLLLIAGLATSHWPLGDWQVEITSEADR